MYVLIEATVNSPRQKMHSIDPIIMTDIFVFLIVKFGFSGVLSTLLFVFTDDRAVVVVRGAGVVKLLEKTESGM